MAVYFGTERNLFSRNWVTKVSNSLNSNSGPSLVFIPMLTIVRGYEVFCLELNTAIAS